jgi:hypothetical protein
VTELSRPRPDWVPKALYPFALPREIAAGRRCFAHATTVVLANTGPYMDEDAPDDVVAAIETWWAEEVEPELQPLGV